MLYTTSSYNNHSLHEPCSAVKRRRICQTLWNVAVTWTSRNEKCLPCQCRKGKRTSLSFVVQWSKSLALEACQQCLQSLAKLWKWNSRFKWIYFFTGKSKPKAWCPAGYSSVMSSYLCVPKPSWNVPVSIFYWAVRVRSSPNQCSRSWWLERDVLKKSGMGIWKNWMQ